MMMMMLTIFNNSKRKYLIYWFQTFLISSDKTLSLTQSIKLNQIVKLVIYVRGIKLFVVSTKLAAANGLTGMF